MRTHLERGRTDRARTGQGQCWLLPCRLIHNGLGPFGGTKLEPLGGVSVSSLALDCKGACQDLQDMASRAGAAVGRQPDLTMIASLGQDDERRNRAGTPAMAAPPRRDCVTPWYCC
jgi:hypothetical protein